MSHPASLLESCIIKKHNKEMFSSGGAYREKANLEIIH